MKQIQREHTGPVGPDGIGADGGVRRPQRKKEGMTMLHSRKRLCALLLSGVMLLSQLPITALAEEYQPQDGQIASFEALPAEVAEQTVPLGTGLDELDLPATVTASVYHVRQDVVIPVVPDELEEPPAQSEPATVGTEPDAPAPEEPVTETTTPEASVQDSGETVVTVATATEDVPVVSWDSAPVYDGDAVGRYVFTPQFQGHTLAPGVQPPAITVTVEEPKPSAITVTNWTFADDTYLNDGVLPLNNVSMEYQADIDKVVSMLPNRISAQIEGETAPVALDLTWSCPDYRQDEQGNWPLSGEYAFTAALPQGYACDPLPTVPVLLPPPGEALSVLAAENGCICTTPCVKDAVNEDCSVCPGTQRNERPWESCAGYRDDYNRTILTMLAGNGLNQENQGSPARMIYYGVLKYGNDNRENLMTYLDLPKLIEVPGQAPLSGKLYFGDNPVAAIQLGMINCGGQNFTEIDLKGCNALQNTALSCAGNPIRRLVLHKNGSSITVKPYSGGTVTISQDFYNAYGQSTYECYFSAVPDKGYEFVGIEGTNWNNGVRLNLTIGSPQHITITPTFRLIAPAEGYSDSDTAAIQKLLSDNGLNQYISNDYVGWETAGLVKWNSETPKRVIELNVNGLGLTSLDVSALTNLTVLDCGDNPIGYLKLSNTHSLTVQTEGGAGKVMLDRFDLQSKQATLTASTSYWGNSFYQWKNASTNKTPTTTVTINGSVTAVAEFQTETSPIYHLGDVEIIRALIHAHGMEGSYWLNPEEWSGDFVLWTDEANNKRIRSLTLRGWEGTVEVSGLTELEWLDLNSSSLSGLVARDLPKLVYLNYSRNPLRSLDLTGCDAMASVVSSNVETLTSYTAPNGNTATVTIEGEHGNCTAYLTPPANGGANPVKVSTKAAAGWLLESVNKPTLDISSGDATATVTFAQVQKPGAPKGLSATGGEEQATLTWEAPDETGGELTGYEVTSDNWATTIPLGSDVFSYTFTDLLAGNNTLKVRAVNTAGKGPEASETCAVSAITKPGAPLDLKATAKGGQIPLTWNAPDSGSAPTGYQVTRDDWAHTIPLYKDATTYSFDSLTNGKYTLKVRAVNKAGEGAEATVDCTVKDEEPPVLSVGSATRVSSTEATVTFTIDEVGVYYYLVSDTEQTNPNIPTDGAGAPCAAGTNTIPLTGLSAGEKFVYITAKDPTGNVASTHLEVTVPASPQSELSIQNTGGGAPVLGTDYLYAGDVLTVLSDTPMTIANLDPNRSTRHRIVVSSPAGATLTLNGVNIETTGNDLNSVPFKIGEDTGAAAVKLLLAKGNRLAGGSGGGLQTQYGAKLTIDSAAGTGSLDGSLVASSNGATNGAGIGGGVFPNSTAIIDITIAGGTIDAITDDGAGIGGGQAYVSQGSGGSITISGNAQVQARAKGFGAGIGGGGGGSSSSDGGDSGTIIIKDDAVVFATTGAGGLAIGGGRGTNGDYGDSSGVNIQGGVVFQRDAGQVYGNVTLPADLEIPLGHTLTVPQGKTLSNNHTLTNQGVIDGMGVLAGDGAFGGDGEYILKVFRTIKTPTAASVAANSVTLNESVVSKGDGKVQYAVSRTPTVPDQWQDSPFFTGLNPSTTYYFFARVTGSKTYEDVVSGAFTQATTEKETYSLSVDKRDLDFGSAETGYSAPASQTVTVTNTGNQAVTLTKPTSNHFLVGELFTQQHPGGGRQSLIHRAAQAGARRGGV